MRHLLRPLLLAALVALTGGCSAAARYGSAARYAPSYRAYVLAPESGADDPDRDDAVIVLRDPVTERKIRCREDLLRWIPHHRRDAVDGVHDENWEIASMFIMLPATVVGALGFDVAAMGIGAAMIPAGIARSEDATSIYDRGVDAFRRQAWEETSNLLELSLVKGERGLATYYLGIAYANMGRSDDAIDALMAFVERSLAQEVTAYRNAERWLAYLDEPIAPCRSQEPIAIAW